MSPLLQSPATTLTVVGLYHLNHPRWEERTGNMNLDQGLSLQALLERRGEQVQRLHHQTVTQGRYTGKGDLSQTDTDQHHGLLLQLPQRDLNQRDDGGSTLADLKLVLMRVLGRDLEVHP